jgi:hypothetical protein
MVYFIEIKTNNESFYKVGFTKSNPRHRLRQLQTSNPFKLRLIKIFPGTLDDEKRVHTYLNNTRGMGEWFKHSPLIEDFLRIPLGNTLFDNQEWIESDGKYLRKWKDNHAHLLRYKGELE